MLCISIKLFQGVSWNLDIYCRPGPNLQISLVFARDALQYITKPEINISNESQVFGLIQY